MTDHNSYDEKDIKEGRGDVAVTAVRDEESWQTQPREYTH